MLKLSLFTHDSIDENQNKFILIVVAHMKKVFDEFILIFAEGIVQNSI